MARSIVQTHSKMEDCCLNSHLMSPDACLQAHDMLVSSSIRRILARLRAICLSHYQILPTLCLYSQAGAGDAFIENFLS